MSQTYEQYLASYHGMTPPLDREGWETWVRHNNEASASLSARAALRTDLNSLARVEHDRNVERGWWDHATELNLSLVRASKLLMMHTEISEAVEGLRVDAMDSHLPHRTSVEVEITDLLIRIMDFAGHMNLDLNGAWDDKSAYNARRKDHDRETRAKVGGKKF